MSTQVTISEVPKYKLSVTDGTDQSLSVTNGIELQLTANSGAQGPSGPAGAIGPAGSAGPAGPNQITTTTSTSLSGFISGNGSTISGATAGSFNTTGSTLVLRDIDGRLQAKQIRLKEAGDTHYTQINPSANTETVSFNFPLDSGTIASNKTAVMKTEDQTVAGDKTFTGQMELTGQAATSSTSAMTRALVDARIMPQAHLHSRLVVSESDFLTTVSVGNGYGNGFSAGVIGSTSLFVAFPPLQCTPNHIGVITMQTTAGALANTGIVMSTANVTPFVFGGHEEYSLIFKPVSFANTVRYRIGFLGSHSTIAITDSVHVEGIGNGSNSVIFSAISTNATNKTTNPTTYTALVNEWYQMKVVINANAASASYYLYSETGTLLWSVTNTTNIPTANTQVGNSFYNTASGATIYAYLDYHKVEVNRTLIR